MLFLGWVWEGRRWYHVIAIVTHLEYKALPTTCSATARSLRSSSTPSNKLDPLLLTYMGKGMVARLSLGLLFLALLLPTQIYSFTPLTSTLDPTYYETTTKSSSGALQSTASFLVVLLILLHLYH